MAAMDRCPSCGRLRPPRGQDGRVAVHDAPSPYGMAPCPGIGYLPRSSGLVPRRTRPTPEDRPRRDDDYGAAAGEGSG